MMTPNAMAAIRARRSNMYPTALVNVANKHTGAEDRRMALLPEAMSRNMYDSRVIARAKESGSQRQDSSSSLSFMFARNL
jgi:hypothetical protein